MDTLTKINDMVNSFAWGTFGLLFLLGTGLICTIATRGFQISHLGHWLRRTFGSLAKEGRVVGDVGAMSQLQAFCTALLATIGTGNITGVSTAICIGGPGAVFWMWIAAILGMMIKFCENVLGIYYRRRNSGGAWAGGAMYYLKDGLGSKKGCKKIGSILAVLFSSFAVLASFGIGNVGQINKIILNFESVFFSETDIGTVAGFSGMRLLIGLILMVVGAFIIMGGFRRLSSISEKLVPFMSAVYILGCIIVILLHVTNIPTVFASIFKFALGTKALAGGAAGTAIQATMKTVESGCKRGVFSNEAGLGSSVMAHINSSTREPVQQGMWGIAEVFVDTMVICTMTALVVLGSGYIDLSTGLVAGGIDDTILVARAFGDTLGRGGEVFVVFCITLFAFTSVMGWSFYGARSMEYLFGDVWARVYRVFFILLIVLGAVVEPSLALDISDTFNGLMMIPNLIGILVLLPLVIKILRNYIRRRIKGIDEEPMLSYDEYIQKSAREKMKKEAHLL